MTPQRTVPDSSLITVICTTFNICFIQCSVIALFNSMPLQLLSHFSVFFFLRQSPFNVLLEISCTFCKPLCFSIYRPLNFTWGMIGLNKTCNSSNICREINVHIYVYIHIYVAIHKEYDLPV